jgi:hypothetical protein
MDLHVNADGTVNQRTRVRSVDIRLVHDDKTRLAEQTLFQKILYVQLFVSTCVAPICLEDDECITTQPQRLAATLVYCAA